MKQTPLAIIDTYLTSKRLVGPVMSGDVIRTRTPTINFLVLNGTSNYSNNFADSLTKHLIKSHMHTFSFHFQKNYEQMWR
jgi:hypothetical protein